MLKAWHASSRLRLACKLSRGAQTAATVRRDDYASIKDADLQHFRSILGDRGVVTDPDALQPLNKSVIVAGNVCCMHMPVSSRIGLTVLLAQRLDEQVRG